MIRSMTGYGRAVMVGGGLLQAVVEITSVNRKNLDIAVSAPREWQRLESGVGEVLKKYVLRGRLNVSVSVESPGSGEATLFNADEVKRALSELSALSESLGIPFEPDVDLLFSIAASIRGKVGLPAAESIQESLYEAVEKAAVEMAAMRRNEGEAIQRDLATRVEELRGQVESIREAAGGVVPDYRETLLRRLRQSGLDFVLDDERVLKEIAIFADRCDISEELTRLGSHFEQFEECLQSLDPVGRKLEFLLQEIGREFNTIGSKANDRAISRLVIESKNELERIREQVQNIE